MTTSSASSDVAARQASRTKSSARSRTARSGLVNAPNLYGSSGNRTHTAPEVKFCARTASRKSSAEIASPVFVFRKCSGKFKKTEDIPRARPMRLMRLNTSGTFSSASGNKSIRDFMEFSRLANRTAAISRSFAAAADDFSTDLTHRDSETPRSLSTSSRDGRLGIAPSFVTVNAPAAAAKRMASDSDFPSLKPTAKAARNASPAAVASTSSAPGGRGAASTRVTSSADGPAMSTAPRAPRVHKTFVFNFPVTMRAAAMISSSVFNDGRAPFSSLAIPANSLSFGAT